MPPHELDRLEQHLAADPRLRQAIVFGSMAADTAKADSDLDLAVDVGRALTPEERLALIADLAIWCGRPVDLVDLCAVGEPLLGQILRHGRRLLGSHADFGRLIARHLTDSADFLPLRRRIQDERRRAWIGK
jgi:predicted nucleotidyltransferase